MREQERACSVREDTGPGRVLLKAGPAPEPSGKDQSGGTVYTQNIYFEGDAVSPYRTAKQIRRQSEDLLMPY